MWDSAWPYNHWPLGGCVSSAHSGLVARAGRVWRPAARHARGAACPRRGMPVRGHVLPWRPAARPAPRRGGRRRVRRREGAAGAELYWPAGHILLIQEGVPAARAGIAVKEELPPGRRRSSAGGICAFARAALPCRAAPLQALQRKVWPRHGAMYTDRHVRVVALCDAGDRAPCKARGGLAHRPRPGAPDKACLGVSLAPKKVPHALQEHHFWGEGDTSRTA